MNTGYASKPPTWVRLISVSQYAPFTSRTMMRPGGGPRQFGEPVEDRRRPLRVGLHGDAEALPTLGIVVAGGALDDLQGQVQARGLLRIDGEVDVRAGGVGGERGGLGREFAEHVFAPCLA